MLIFNNICVLVEFELMRRVLIIRLMIFFFREMNVMSCIFVFVLDIMFVGNNNKGK